MIAPATSSPNPAHSSVCSWYAPEPWIASATSSMPMSATSTMTAARIPQPRQMTNGLELLPYFSCECSHHWHWHNASHGALERRREPQTAARLTHPHDVGNHAAAVLVCAGCQSGSGDGRGPRRFLDGPLARDHRPGHVRDLTLYRRCECLRGRQQRELVRLRLRARDHDLPRRRGRGRRYQATALSVRPKAHPMTIGSDDSLQLLDWKRRVFELYARVRAADDPRAAWHEWRATRDDLFANHPQSPIPPSERGSFRGLAYFDYDPAYRVLARVQTAEPERFDIVTSGDEAITFNRTGTADFEVRDQELRLELYWLEG